jgi:fermentation-respiration switch protein FrsA (DUF1100 family)
VALAPVADVAGADRERLGDSAVLAFVGGPASARPDLDPTRMVSAIEPVVLLHGTDDAIVPLRQSEAYAAAHRESELRPLPGAGHFALIDPLSAAWPSVVEAVRDMAARRTVEGVAGPT